MSSLKTLTVLEVKDILRTDEWEVRRLCQTGKLAASKPGKRWLITEDAVRDYLAEHSNQQASA